MVDMVDMVDMVNMVDMVGDIFQSIPLYSQYVYLPIFLLKFPVRKPMYLRCHRPHSGL